MLKIKEALIFVQALFRNRITRHETGSTFQGWRLYLIKEVDSSSNH